MLHIPSRTAPSGVGAIRILRSRRPRKGRRSFEHNVGEPGGPTRRSPAAVPSGTSRLGARSACRYGVGTAVMEFAGHVRERGYVEGFEDLLDGLVEAVLGLCPQGSGEELTGFVDEVVAVLRS